MVAYPGNPMPRKRPEELRNHRWYGATDRRAFDHRSRSAQMGYDRSDYGSKPVIAEGASETHALAARGVVLPLECEYDNTPELPAGRSVKGTGVAGIQNS